MASISCPQCGTPVDARSPFCGYCGYSMKASEIATSRPPDGQQRGGYSSPDNQPPPFPIGNMPSLPTYPVSGSPSSHTHPASGSPSSFTYPASGSPPPPPTYPAGGSPSSFTFPPNASPPPSYQPDNNAFRFPSGAYPSNEANLPPQQLQQQPQIQPPPQPPRRRKKGMIAILVVAALVIVGGAVLAGALYATHSPLLAKVGLGSSTSTPSTIATQAPTATPAQNVTATPIATTDTSTSTPSTTSTSTSSTPTAVTTQISASSNYSATQPGPGCDTNGGTWTPQGISNITCGTRISVSSGNARGYLYLQLPNDAAFAPNNSIGISGAVQDYSPDCVGLAEQDANTGFLAEYCDNGNWYIYSISSAGATIKTLAQSITSTRTSEQLLLTLSGSTLSFSIDSEVHKINVSPIQPTKVAITYVSTYGSGSTTITNFSYTTQTS